MNSRVFVKPYIWLSQQSQDATVANPHTFVHVKDSEKLNGRRALLVLGLNSLRPEDFETNERLRS